MRRGALIAAIVLSFGSGSGASARPPEPVAPAASRAPSTPTAMPAPTVPAPALGATQSPRGGVSTGSPDPLTLDDAALAQLVQTDLGALGSLSLGRPNAGALLGGVQMTDGPSWQVVDPGRSWATRETIGYLERAFADLRRAYPDAPPVFVGHLSREHGGALGPHRSHQSGRDADLSYIYKPGMHLWYQRASARTLDVARTWALVRALVTDTDVEAIFMDLGVQKLLKEHALAIGEDARWLDSVFRYQSKDADPLIRHAWGHASHLHVRFYNPRAQALGIRAYAPLADLGRIAPRLRIMRYQAKAGDSLAALAVMAGNKVETIRQLNGLGEDDLSSGKVYLVPVRGQVAEVKELVIAPRRLPPPKPAAPARAEVSAIVSRGGAT
jgi:murein endopeptidase